jgi:hypothetical protein
MLRMRYVVMTQARDWVVFQGRRRLGAFPDKTQATSAAIGLAEDAGTKERPTEVLVRHEDGRFLTEWTFGVDIQADSAARPIIPPTGH